MPRAREPALPLSWLRSWLGLDRPIEVSSAEAAPDPVATELAEARLAFEAAAPSWPHRDAEAVLREALRAGAPPEPIRWTWYRSHFTTGPQWWELYGDGRLFRGGLSGTRREEAPPELVERALSLLVENRVWEPELPASSQPGEGPAPAHVADAPVDRLCVDAAGVRVDFRALQGPRGACVRAGLSALLGMPG